MEGEKEGPCTARLDLHTLLVFLSSLHVVGIYVQVTSCGACACVFNRFLTSRAHTCTRGEGGQIRLTEHQTV